MTTILAILAASALTFWLGYHLGHQIGMTEHIRRHLKEVRQKRHASGDTGSGLHEHSGFSR